MVRCSFSLFAVVFAVVACLSCSSCSRQVEESAKPQGDVYPPLPREQLEEFQRNAKKNSFKRPRLSAAHESKAKADIKALDAAVTEYRLAHPETGWPETLYALTTQDEQKKGPYLSDPKLLVDPWGSHYLYDAEGGNNGGRKPDIWTIAPDDSLFSNWRGR